MAVVYTGGAAYAAFSTSAALSAAATSAAMYGAGIGAAIGGYAGYQAGGTSGMLRGMLLGAVVGGVTGAAGVWAANGYGTVASGAIQGFFGGFGTGVSVGYQGGRGSVSSIRDGGLVGGFYGLVIGAAVGYANDWLGSGKELGSARPDSTSTTPPISGSSDGVRVSMNGVKGATIQNAATTIHNFVGAPLANAAVRSLVTNIATAYVLYNQEYVSSEAEKAKNGGGTVSVSCETDEHEKPTNCK